MIIIYGKEWERERIGREWKRDREREIKRERGGVIIHGGEWENDERERECGKARMVS